jgi:hypothetical protein
VCGDCLEHKQLCLCVVSIVCVNPAYSMSLFVKYFDSKSSPGVLASVHILVALEDVDSPIVVKPLGLGNLAATVGPAQRLRLRRAE